jgi:hypothetical protein
MDFKATRLCLVCLLPLPTLAADLVSSGYREYQSPVNYNFFQVSLGGGEISPDDSEKAKLTVSTLSAQWMASESWILGVHYTGRFSNYDDSSDRGDYLKAQAGYRFPVLESTDIVVQGNLGYAWLELEDDSGATLYDDGNGTVGVNVGAYHGFTESFEGRFVVEYMDSDISNETTFELAGDYYFNPHFSFGAYGKYVMARHSDLNHYGISAKIRF